MTAWVNTDTVEIQQYEPDQIDMSGGEDLLGTVYQNTDSMLTGSYNESRRKSKFTRLSEELSDDSCVSIFLAWTTLDPNGIVALYWDALICMVVAYNLVFLPIRFGFPLFEERYRKFWYFTDYLADLYYLLDIAIRIRTSYLVQGCLEYNWKLIATHYFQSWEFVFDTLSIFPLDFLLIRNQVTPYQNYIVSIRLNRLIKYNRIYAFIGRAESRSDFPNIIRLGSLVLILVSIIHCNSCLYFFISTMIAYNDTWVFPGTEGIVRLDANTSLKVIIPDKSLINQYFHSLHWSTQMLTTIAEVNTPTRSIEYAYSIALLLFAVLMFATLVGNVGNVLISLNAARTRFESRLDNVKQYMHNRNIDEALQENVLLWFDHLWEKNRGIDEQETLHNLPNKLRAQIAVCANKKVLTENKIYKLGDEGYKIDLVLKLRSELFPPNETVYRRGNIGNDMYIIRSGKVKLTNRVNNQSDTELGEGDCFGMICVINFDEFGRERSETAQTVGFCDILLLEKKDLIELLVDYPDVKEELSQQFEAMKTELTTTSTPRSRRKKGVDIALVTRDVNALILKYDSLKEQYGCLFEQHRKLITAIRQLS